MHGTHQRPDDGAGGSGAALALAEDPMAPAPLAGERESMKGLNQSLPSILVIAVLVGVWWVLVKATQSVIFPTPWQVVSGTLELAADGTLWEHIGASLFRVGAGFGIAVLLAIPLGLWMGWVH